ncbi:MAG: ribonuclease Z [Flavobacteriales bacterium]|nr:ribonuclease Z [Flavobacteriales bacterium]
MTKFSILILGSASASPTLNRNPSSQLININENYFLIDCGEGTQYRLREHKIKFQRIHHIFISHLHGDHYFGLPGLLQTMSLLGRKLPLNLYGPPQLKEILELNFKHSQSFLKFPLNFYATNSQQQEVLLENDFLTVSTVILDHRIPCTGFIFREKQKPFKINPTAIKHFKVPHYLISDIKLGSDFYSSEENKLIKNGLLTFQPDKSFSYAYCSDTKYNEQVALQIKDVVVLYHEATFINKDNKRASETFHSTAEQAAKIATIANANLLIIGHFSNRYSNLNILLEDAKLIFENTLLGIDNTFIDMSKIQ